MKSWQTPIWASICTPVAPILLISWGHSPRLGGHKQSFGGTAPECPITAPGLEADIRMNRTTTGRLLDPIRNQRKMCFQRTQSSTNAPSPGHRYRNGHSF